MEVKGRGAARGKVLHDVCERNLAAQVVHAWQPAHALRISTVSKAMDALINGFVGCVRVLCSWTEFVGCVRPCKPAACPRAARLHWPTNHRMSVTAVPLAIGI